MAMFTIEDIVSSAFSDASFGLEVTELLEMVHVVTLQVDSSTTQNLMIKQLFLPSLPPCCSVQPVTSGLA
jgi:hypothetical protein